MINNQENQPVYDFDTLYPRLNMGAAKWAALEKDRRSGDLPGLAPDIFPFSTADMDFKIAPEIQAVLHQEIDFGIFGYMQLTDRYYRAVCGWMARRHQVRIEPDWIVQVPGIVPALYQLVRAFTAEGDGVIVQPPVYGPFFAAVEKQGRRLVRNPLRIRDGRWQMDLDDLAVKAADPHTTMLILCSPHNPVGRVWTRAELAAVARICRDNQVFLISDEIHADLVYAPHRHTMLSGLGNELPARCAICTAPSKTFNLAGLATANLILPDESCRQRYLDTIHALGGNMGNHLGTMACIAAYESGETWYRSLMNYLDGNRALYGQFMREHLPELPTILPEGTYLAWFDARRLGRETDELSRFMRQNAQMYFGEGNWFGAEGAGWERLNFALPRQALLAGLLRLEQAVCSRP